MRILVISDIDDLHWKHGSGNADVLLSCGDLFDQVILEAAEAWGCRKIFAVKGNHDNVTPFPAPIIDLHLQIQKYGGFSFGGLNGAWKYKQGGHFLYNQGEIDSFLATFPSVDIFLSHNSPRNIHERDGQVHQGFSAINGYIKRTSPKLHIHGHQHHFRQTTIAKTIIIAIYGHKMIDIVSQA